MMVGHRIDAQSLVDEIKDEQWWKLVELKKFCLDKAIWHSTEKEGEVVRRSQEYYDFLMGDFKPVVTFTDNEQPETSEREKDNITVSAVVIGDIGAVYDKDETVKGKKSPEREKALDLERIIDCELLCKCIFTTITGINECNSFGLSMGALRFNEYPCAITLSLFHDGTLSRTINRLDERDQGYLSAMRNISTKKIDKLLEPYWI